MIEAFATKGLDKLLDYGLAVTVMALSGVCAFYLVKYLLQRCDERFLESLKMHQETTDRVIEVVNHNTKAISEFRSELRK